MRYFLLLLTSCHLLSPITQFSQRIRQNNQRLDLFALTNEVPLPLDHKINTDIWLRSSVGRLVAIFSLSSSVDRDGNATPGWTRSLSPQGATRRSVTCDGLNHYSPGIWTITSFLTSNCGLRTLNLQVISNTLHCNATVRPHSNRTKPPNP